MILSQTILEEKFLKNDCPISIGHKAFWKFIPKIGPNCDPKRIWKSNLFDLHQLIFLDKLVQRTKLGYIALKVKSRRIEDEAVVYYQVACGVVKASICLKLFSQKHNRQVGIVELRWDGEKTDQSFQYWFIFSSDTGALGSQMCVCPSVRGKVL